MPIRQPRDAELNRRASECGCATGSWRCDLGKLFHALAWRLVRCRPRGSNCRGAARGIAPRRGGRKNSAAHQPAPVSTRGDQRRVSASLGGNIFRWRCHCGCGLRGCSVSPGEVAPIRSTVNRGVRHGPDRAAPLLPQGLIASPQPAECLLAAGTSSGEGK